MRPLQVIDPLSKFKVSQLPSLDPTCPFCVGNESHTPEPELLRYSSNDKWQVRVVNNMYPSVQGFDSIPDHASHPPSFDATSLHATPMKEMIAAGMHEVVIESPEHNCIMSSTSVEQSKRIVRAWKARGVAMRENLNVNQFLIFKNHGADAGASLAHPHSQLMGLPVVPNNIIQNLSYSRKFYERRGFSVFEYLIEKELESMAKSEQHRVIDINEDFVAMVPWAALCPFHLWILPREKASTANFSDLDDSLLDSFSDILRRVMYRLYKTLDEPDYNLVVRSAPFNNRGRQKVYQFDSFFSWYVAIYPRVGGAGMLGGFELLSGIYSNPNMPESDAKTLRDVDMSGFV